MTQPDYPKWLAKAVWSMQETLYLVAGLDPAQSPKNLGVYVDLETGDSEPAELDRAVLRTIAEAAVEMERRGVSDLIKRAVAAGDLKPTDPDRAFFRPREIIEYLLRHGVALPAGLEISGLPAEGDHDAPRRPLPQLRFQEQEILKHIAKLGYDPKALPKNKPGMSGVKAEVRKRLTPQSSDGLSLQYRAHNASARGPVYVAMTIVAFNKAWERLLAQHDIQYKM